MNYSTKTNKELKELLCLAGLPISGNKEQLIDRLVYYDEKNVKFNICFKTISCKVYTIEMNKTNYVSCLKKKIEELTNIQYDKQKIYYVSNDVNKIMKHQLVSETDKLDSYNYDNGEYFSVCLRY